MPSDWLKSANWCLILTLDQKIENECPNAYVCVCVCVCIRTVMCAYTYGLLADMEDGMGQSISAREPAQMIRPVDVRLLLTQTQTNFCMAFSDSNELGNAFPRIRCL